MSHLIGTTHHGLCPICGYYTVDKTDGECHNLNCNFPEPEDWYEEHMKRELAEELASFNYRGAKQIHDDEVDAYYNEGIDDEEGEREYMKSEAKHRDLTEDERIIYGL